MYERRPRMGYLCDERRSQYVMRSRCPSPCHHPLAFPFEWFKEPLFALNLPAFHSLFKTSDISKTVQLLLSVSDND